LEPRRPRRDHGNRPPNRARVPNRGEVAAAPTEGSERRNCFYSPIVTPHRLPETFTALPTRPPLPVVCAVIEDGRGHVLIAQRPAHKHLPLKWEFAGGKIEPNETPEAALEREICEELGCNIVVGRALPPFIHDYGDIAIEMYPFVCRLADGSAAPHPHEHASVRWIAPADLASVDLAAADWPVVAAYAS
jgi:8-oxo-dGTP diphosphatase